MKIYRRRSKNEFMNSKDDSDYEMNDGEDSDKEKERKKRLRAKIKVSKECRFGKNNLHKYLFYEVIKYLIK
jgi:hypothetical protein